MKTAAQPAGVCLVQCTSTVDGEHSASACRIALHGYDPVVKPPAPVCWSRTLHTPDAPEIPIRNDRGLVGVHVGVCMPSLGLHITSPATHVSTLRRRPCSRSNNDCLSAVVYRTLYIRIRPRQLGRIVQSQSHRALVENVHDSMAVGSTLYAAPSLYAGSCVNIHIFVKAGYTPSRLNSNDVKHLKSYQGPQSESVPE